MTRVAVVGEVVVDEDLVAEKLEVSSEGPFFRAVISRGEMRVGGAGHAVKALAELGDRVTLFTVLGDDEEGDFVEGWLKSLGVEVVASRCGKTVKVSRVKHRGHTVMRLDSAEEVRGCKLDFDLSSFDAVLISEHGRGLIDHSVVAKATSYKLPVVANPSPKGVWAMEGVTMIRINRSDACSASGITAINETSVRNAGLKIKAELRPRAVLVTWLEDSSFLFLDGKTVKLPPLPYTPVNYIGLGDVISAVLTDSLARGLGVEESAELSLVAGYLYSSKREAQLTRDKILKEYERVKGVTRAG